MAYVVPASLIATGIFYRAVLPGLSGVRNEPLGVEVVLVRCEICHAYDGSGKTDIGASK